MSSTYRVILAPEARKALEAAYHWIEERAPQQAKIWINGFILAIKSLERMPARCPIAAESVFFEQELRQLFYGKRGHTYRALFVIDSDTVNVLFIRHYAQDWVRPEE